jgi:glucose-6-phosphate dehydrogenase assembly protein OpcA
MIEDLWSESDTTPDAIDAALRELLRERHAANRALAPARVLNLVVIVERDWKGEIANRLQRVGRYHASRTVLCAVQEGRHTLDARAVIGYEEPEPGTGLGVMHESVQIDIGPEHLAHLQTIIDPVLVSELPTMLWSPHGREDAVESVLPLIDVILLDSDELSEPREAFAGASRLLRTVYVVDLAWLRTTPWRERLAASFDPPRRRRALREIASVAVRHRSSSVASAILLAGWLASRLRWDPHRLAPRNGSGLTGAANADSGPVEVALEPVELQTPGLAGLTVGCHTGLSLSLDRGRGGLIGRERVHGAGEREWRVLGAARGEGGILGEGVRQALLRDDTYAPALAAARRFCR